MRTLIAWGIAGLAGLLAYLVFENVARPGIQVEIEVGRTEAAERALNAIERHGFDVSGLERATIFSNASEARTFLEKEFSREEVNRILNGDLAIFHWYTRWFAPGEHTDYRAWIRPDGSLNGFSRGIPDDAEGARIGPEAAAALAQEFLARQGRDLTGWSINRQSAEELANRTDHLIVWEQDDFAGAPAFRRLWVEIQGDEVGGYREFVETPEAWKRAQSGDNAWRRLLQQLSGLPYNVLLAVVVGLLLLYVRAGAVRLGFGLLLAVFVTGVDAAANLNELPMRWIGYATNQPVAGFWLSALWEIVRSAVSTFFLVAVMALVAEVLGRELGGVNSRIADLRKPSAWAQRDNLTAIYIGYCLMGLHLAYNTFFYIVGREVFGVWSPQPSIYSNLLSTPFPFLYPLTTGLSAAVQEELAFRLIATALLFRISRSWSVAVAVPALVWGFQHSLYPQDPFYIRGVELTVVGIAYGVVFLRYGLLATLISHFGYNAVVSSEILLGSDAPSLRLYGAVVCLVMTAPFWPAALRLVRGEGLAQSRHDESNLGERVPLPPFRPSKVVLFAQDSALVPRNRLLALTALSALALASLGAADALFEALMARDRIALGRSGLARALSIDTGPDIDVECCSTKAGEAANAYLASLGVDPAAWRSTVSWRNRYESEEMDYLYQQLGPERYWEVVESLFQQNAQWVVWYFRPEDPEEYYVYILPDGTPRAHIHYLPEDAPGAQLTQDEARDIAEQYLRDDPRIEFDDYIPADSNTSVFARRTDHWFAYEWTGLNPEEASIRLSVYVSGERPFFPDHRVVVPNTWTRARAERDTVYYVFSAYAGALLIAIGVFLGGVFVHCFVSGAMPWRVALLLALAMASLEVIEAINGIPTWWSSYATDTDPAVYTANRLTNLASGVAYTFAIYWALFSLAGGLFRLYVGRGATFLTLVRQIPRARWAEAAVVAGNGWLTIAAGGMFVYVGILALSFFPSLWAPITIMSSAPTPDVPGFQFTLSATVRDIVDILKESVNFMHTVTLMALIGVRYLSSVKRFAILYCAFIILAILAHLSKDYASHAEMVIILTFVSALFWLIFVTMSRVFSHGLPALVLAAALPVPFLFLDSFNQPDWVAAVLAAFLIAAFAAAAYVFRQPPPGGLESPPDHLSS